MDTAEPLYRQLAAELASAIRQGGLPPGARLATVRAMAAERGLDVNTVNRAYQLLARQGLVEAHARRGTVVRRGVFAPPPAGASDEILVSGSHDFGLDLLARQLQPHGVRLRVEPVGSTLGLQHLAAGHAHLAGSHLLDDDGAGYNHDAARRLLAGHNATLITLVEREQGFLVPRGNSRRVRSPADLADPGLRIVNRQPGSGTRVLLDRLLAQAGLAGASIAGYEREVVTHLEVAAAVAAGSADVGLGLAAAARALDLDFVPITVERYDLAVLAEQRDSPWFGRLIEALASSRFRRSIEALGGYDGAYSGWLRGV